MTKKQLRKYADEIYENELIHRDANSSPKQKKNAEQRIMQISRNIFALPDGAKIMLQIDDLVKDKLDKLK